MSELLGVFGSSWRSRLFLTLVGLGAIGSLGCSSAAFKLGASPDAIARDEQACRAASEGDEDYAECMRSRGYSVLDPEDMPEATSDSLSTGPASRR